MPHRTPAHPLGILAGDALPALPSALLLTLLWLLGAPDPASSGPPLPFDPLPSAFQRWLNARPTPAGQPMQRYSQLSRCSDFSSGGSPYRSPGYRCLSGELTLGSGSSRQVCRLLEVSFNLRNGQVRHRPVDCRPLK